MLQTVFVNGSAIGVAEHAVARQWLYWLRGTNATMRKARPDEVQSLERLPAM